MKHTNSWFQLVSFHEWWADGDDQARLPLIDIRSLIEYQNCRIEVQNTLVVHLPLDSLNTGERSGELPPRHVEFALLVATDERHVLESVIDFFGATKSRATQQSRQPWRVRQILVASPELWSHASDYGVIREGPAVKGGADVFTPLPRLWEPDPLVEHVLLPLLRQSISTSRDEELDSTEIWDLGCGAGRDVCFLAEQLKELGAIKFVGIDNHKASGQRCVPFWKHRGVADCTEARLLNLNKVDLVKEELESCRVVCFFAVRFLNRKLVSLLANDVSLDPGTLFAMSHFCKPRVGAEWDFDHPKKKHVLERDELQSIFEQQGKWEILHNDIGSDGDHGRPLIKFVARRVH